MNEEQQLRLQAFLDGELPEREAREVLAWTQRDADAAALLTELRNTRQAIAKSELHLSVPEAREFYWSKIEREIQKLEPAQTRTPEKSFFAGLRRFLLPAGATAALVIAGLFAYSHLGTVAVVAANDSDETVVETDQAGSDATTYRDEADGTTLVWFSAAADNSMNGKLPGAIN
jgi:anti-sigma factor RsiW